MVSSHLLDEVEKTCDMVAIIDRGRLVASGPVIGDRRGGRQVLVGCDDPGRAEALLRGQHAVARVAHDANGLLTVTPGQGVR